MAQTSGIENPQRAMWFQPALLRIQGMACRTPQGPIGLESEIDSSKSFGVGSACPLRWPIADKLAPLNRLLSLNWLLSLKRLLSLKPPRGLERVLSLQR